MSLLPLFYVQSPVLLGSFYFFRSKFGLTWIFVLVLSIVESYCETLSWIIFLDIFLKNFIIRLQRLNPCDEKTTKAKWRLKEVRNLYLYNIWSLLENSKHFRIKNSLQTILKFVPVFFFASFTHSSSVKMVQGQLWIAMLAVFFLRQRSLLFKKLLYLFKDNRILHTLNISQGFNKKVGELRKWKVTSFL